jgi:hypothetical protein
MLPILSGVVFRKTHFAFLNVISGIEIYNCVLHISFKNLQVSFISVDLSSVSYRPFLILK